MANKVKVATVSLAGCFCCHMSHLDIDERLLDLLEQVEFDRTPLNDIKHIGDCDSGLIEGGVANAENVQLLKQFREHCKTLGAVRACAINAGIPAMRNQYLETAPHPEHLRRVAIEPVTRIEGHGKVTLLLDDDNHVQQVRLHIVEFRGFEKFIQARPYWEVPVLVQRLCGICPVSHHLAAAKAADVLMGARQLFPTAEKIRRLTNPKHHGEFASIRSNMLSLVRRDGALELYHGGLRPQTPLVDRSSNTWTI